MSYKLPKEWLQNCEEKGTPEAYNTIIDFFCVHSPFPDANISLRGKPLQSFPWYQSHVSIKDSASPVAPKPQTKKRLLTQRVFNTMIRKGSLEEIPCYIWSHNEKNALTSILGSLLLTPSSFSGSFCEERLFFRETGDSYFEGLVYHLRNALAHGRFYIEQDFAGRFVYKIDVTKGSHLYARMILREKTLLDWVELITTGKGILPGYQQIHVLDTLS